MRLTIIFQPSLNVARDGQSLQLAHVQRGAKAIGLLLDIATVFCELFQYLLLIIAIILNCDNIHTCIVNTVNITQT